MIIERPIRNNIRVETLTRAASPFVLGDGILGYSKLALHGTPQTWAEWTAATSAITISRGGTLDGITIRNNPGMATLTIHDVDIARSVIPEFYREQPIRITSITPAGEHRIFTGWVREVEQHYGGFHPGTQKPRTSLTVTAVDAVARHDEVTRYGAISNLTGETLAQRITRLRASSTAPIEIPTDDYRDAANREILFAPTVFESSLSNHLTLAANTAGAMWFVDGDGITRFQPRIFDAANALVFRNLVFPDGDLSAIAYTPATATETGYNTSLIRNKTAARDPETGDWANVETDELHGVISLRGRQTVILETNALSHDYITHDNAWLAANRFGWGTIIGRIRWNAQQDLTRIPDLEIGKSVTAAIVTPELDTGWSQYLVAGVEHTITPTRWMTNLTVIGAQ